VGNSTKVEYLVDTFGIARDHIFNSRDASFLHNIKAATNGRGVDVVLNSLSGELLHASWDCVAEFGTHLEIGKRDFIGHASLSMNLFQQNRRFVGIDYSQICNERHDMVRK
jgi:NADPH:quinone reductase-like Zn-dependent oxidoreductase